MTDGVRPHAAFGDLHVLLIGAAKQHHQPGVARNRRPGRERTGHGLGAAKHMRQKHQRGAKAVIRGLIDEAAEDSHEPAQLPARFVKNSGRAPALRTRHDGVVAIVTLDAGQFAGNEIERALP